MKNFISGSCCVIYEACKDQLGSFSISSIVVSAVDNACNQDYIIIEGSICKEL